LSALVALCTRALIFVNVAFAAPMQTVTVRQSEPGAVTVTVRGPAASPPADSFSLQLPETGAAPVRIKADSVTPADALSPDLATTVLLAVDRSGSMHAAVPAIKSALRDVLAAPRPDLRIGVMSFGSDTPEPTPFSSDPAKIGQAVDAIRAETGKDGKTRLYDAISMGMSALARDPSPGPKRLVVITDGKDEGSRTNFDALAEQLKGRAFAMDSIAFGPLAPRSSAGIATLSSRTSGTFVLAKDGGNLGASLRDGLGTAPAPAFDVTFRYPADTGATLPPGSAQLEFASAGAQPVMLPIQAALAAPASASSPSFVPQATAKVNADKAPPRNYFMLGPMRVNVKLGVGLLVALAIILSMIALRLRRPKRQPEARPAMDINGPYPMSGQLRRATQTSAIFAPPARGKPTAVLVSDAGMRTPLTFSIERPNVRIGADKESDLVVYDDFVSRKHAQIRFESGSLYLTDLKSSNGTFLNGARVSRVVTLTPGDKIRFGHTTWEVRRPGDASQPSDSGKQFERPVP
jgi:Mg-chelatase subunit ChlD